MIIKFFDVQDKEVQINERVNGSKTRNSIVCFVASPGCLPGVVENANEKTVFVT